jgi:hypothetical protein
VSSRSSEKILESSDSRETVIGSDRVKYSYTDFSVVDHRVKLHLYLHVFQQEQEDLLFLLRVSIVTVKVAGNVATKHLLCEVSMQERYKLDAIFPDLYCACHSRLNNFARGGA